jgi:hypothetical protein
VLSVSSSNQELRNVKRNTYYEEESWVNEGVTVSKQWKDTTIKTPRQAFA